jgi:hypothetical protein
MKSVLKEVYVLYGLEQRKVEGSLFASSFLIGEEIFRLTVDWIMIAFCRLLGLCTHYWFWAFQFL